MYVLLFFSNFESYVELSLLQIRQEYFPVGSLRLPGEYAENRPVQKVVG
jgi:hypothetical protein